MLFTDISIIEGTETHQEVMMRLNTLWKNISPSFSCSYTNKINAFFELLKCTARLRAVVSWKNMFLYYNIYLCYMQQNVNNKRNLENISTKKVYIF